MSEYSDHDPDAQVSRLIESGRHVEAFLEATTLADAGHLGAQLQLAWMYQTGTGTSKDLEQAERWFSRVVPDPSGRAEAFLGRLFRDRQDFARSRAAFEASAAKGYAPASYSLGRMYLFGKGVSADETRAYAYFEEAAARGHLFARSNLARRKMSGRLGLRHVPAGVAALVGTAWTGLRIGWKDPHDERFLRL